MDGSKDSPRMQRRMLLDTVLLGVVGALSAQLFLWMLAVAQRLLLEGVAGYLPPMLPEEGGEGSAHEAAFRPHPFVNVTG